MTNKASAITDIMREATARQRTKAGLVRVLRAFDTLGLSKDEGLSLLTGKLCYCNHEGKAFGGDKANEFQAMIDGWLAKAK